MKHLRLNSHIGQLGENLVTKRLESQGYKILAKNYLENTGEIDIIAIINTTIHFIEVKSVSCESLSNLNKYLYNPFDKVDGRKLNRMYKTIELYLHKNKLSSDIIWQIDLYAVYIDQKSKQAKIKTLENIIV